MDSGGSLASDIQLSLDAAGEGAVVGLGADGSSINASGYQPGPGWEAVTQVAQSTGTVQALDVSTDAGDGSSTVWAAVRGQGAWQSPANVGSTTTDSVAPQVHVAPDGNAMVLWTSDALEERRYVQGSGWEANSTAVSTAGGSSFGVGL